MTTKFTLQANERLKSRKAIQQLFKEGKSFSHFPFRIIYLKNENNPAGLKAGFSVSKRNFKKAVDRNRIKRLMREAYRLQKNELKAMVDNTPINFSVFFIYTGNELPKYELVFERIGGALDRLRGLVSS